MTTNSINGCKSYRSDNGFTLIELILVILILGIIAGVAVPSIRGILDETTLDEATQEVVNALRYARNLAIQNNATRLVDLNPSLETCTLLLGYQSSGNNLLTFENILNPPGSDRWGVRNVKVSNGKIILFQDNTAYGNISGGDTTHVDKMDYNFNGEGQKLKLAYSVYDADTSDEIAIYFNGFKVADAGKGPIDKWRKTTTIDLPSVIVGDVSVRNALDKRLYVINFNTSDRLAGVDIVSANFSGLDDVLYYPDGSLYSGGSIVLSFKGRSRTITVESETGNISIQ